MKPSHQIKVVTCCYCGARSTLEQTKTRNLICHGCGASIQKLEAVQPVLERMHKARNPDDRPKKQALPHRAEGDHRHLDKDRPARRKKGKYKKKRSMWYHVAEAFDDLDDIFDIFD